MDGWMDNLFPVAIERQFCFLAFSGPECGGEWWRPQHCPDADHPAKERTNARGSLVLRVDRGSYDNLLSACYGGWGLPRGGKPKVGAPGVVAERAVLRLPLLGPRLWAPPLAASPRRGVWAWQAEAAVEISTSRLRLAGASRPKSRGWLQHP